MSVTELLVRAKKSASTRTKEDRKKILVEAKIITRKGTYNSRYFSKETVEENRNKTLNVL